MNKNFIDYDKSVLPISMAAEALKVHQRTLRIYDNKKILSPRRSTKNKRLYSFNDIEKGEFIQYLTQNLGLNIAGVKIILGMLKELKVSPDKYKETIEEIALKSGFNSEKQDRNKQKLSKRGRKCKKGNY